MTFSRRGVALAAFLLLSTSLLAQGPLVTLEGPLEVLIEDHVGRAVMRHFVQTDAGRRMEIRYRGGPPPPVVGGERVRATGRRADAMTLGGATVEPITPRTTLPPNTFGIQQTLVMLVNFQDRLFMRYTVPTAQEIMNQVDVFYRANTYGQTTVSSTVVGWYTLPVNSTSCDQNTWAALADQAATAHGIMLSQFRRKVYAFPQVPACSWWGLGSVGGNPSRAWINGNFQLQVVGHEMAHNFGDYHSHSMSCDVNGCRSSEYGDDRDILGATSTGHLNAFQKERLGWLNYQTSPTVQTVTESRAYSIELLEVAPMGGPKALKILKATDAAGAKTWYYVEARMTTSSAGKPPVATSAYVVDVHTGSEANANSSTERDLLPVVSTYDTILDIAQSFLDPAIGLTLTTTALGTTGATVQVTFGPVTVTPPSGPVKP